MLKEKAKPEKTLDGNLRNKQNQILPFLAVLHHQPYVVTVDSKGVHTCTPDRWKGNTLTFKSREEMKAWKPKES